MSAPTIEKRAALTASAVAFFLLIIKLTVGILSGSVAILASAIDSLLDIAISVFNFFALKTAQIDADEKFNYGRGKIEAIAAVIEGVIITISGIYILYLSIDKLITEQETFYIFESVMVMLVSSVTTLLLVLYLNSVAKKSKSLIIKADALHYKMDLLTNGGILVALLLIYITDFHIIDGLVGIAIALYIIYSAIELIKEGVYVLLDVALEPEMVKQIKDIIDNTQAVNSFHDLKTRRSSKDIFVNVHLVFDHNISLLKAHQISDIVDDNIQLIDPHFNWTINIHLDPHDDSK